MNDIRFVVTLQDPLNEQAERLTVGAYAGRGAAWMKHGKVTVALENINGELVLTVDDPAIEHIHILGKIKDGRFTKELE